MDIHGYERRTSRSSNPQHPNAKPRPPNSTTTTPDAPLLRSTNPEAEIDKMLDVGIIYPTNRTTWVSPIVVVPKKNIKIRICVNYREVNDATIKDNYPVPNIKHLLERVAWIEAYSFINGFSEYNQISVIPEDQHKKNFATKFSMFAYKHMPFRLTSSLG